MMRTIICFVSLGVCLGCGNNKESEEEQPSPKPVIEIKKPDLPDAAVVEVTGIDTAQPSDREVWPVDDNVPPFLREGTLYARHLKEDKEQNNNGKLEFRVKKGGVVLISATWDDQGGRDEQWYKTRTSRKQLTDDGWEPIYSYEYRHVRYYVFRRVVKEGESFAYHTSDQRTPGLIVPISYGIPPVLKQQVVKLAAHDLSHIHSIVEGKSAAGVVGVHVTTNNPNRTESREPCMLLRELVRQGVLLAARDELGQTTSDTSLGESPTFADDGHAPPLGTLVSFDASSLAPNPSLARTTLFRHRTTGVEPIWDDTVRVSSNRIQDLASQVEAWSRDDFVRALVENGSKGKPNRVVDAGEVSDSVAALLWQLNFVPQFTVTRLLHQEIRDQGESPQRLAALARSYANLSVLTTYHFHPDHKAFAARGLLYAERLVARDGGSKWSLWNRGYVRAMIGLLQAGLDDLDAAKESAGEKETSMPPAWVALTRAFCEYDRKTLAITPDDANLRPLAKLLDLLAIEPWDDSSLTIEACQALLEMSPSCFRAADSFAEVHTLGTKRIGAAAGPAMVVRFLYYQLLEIRDLPDAARQVVQDFKKGIDRQEIGSTEDENVFRIRLVKALRESALENQSAGEMNWTVLANLIDELSFVHAWREVDFLKNCLCVPCDDEIARLKPLVGNHPYWPFIASQTSNAQHNSQVLTDLAAKLDETSVPLATFSFHHAIKQYVRPTDERFPKNFADEFFAKGSGQADLTYGDIGRVLSWIEEGGRRRYVKPLRRVAPHTPLAAAVVLLHDWDHSKDQAEIYLEKFGEVVGVQSALGRKYLELEQYESAEKALKKCVEMTPNLSTYSLLADVYKKQDQDDKWLATLEEFLEKGESFGLEHAQVNSRIAYHFINNKDWKTALPYAEVAAESYSAWGLRCAAECHDALGNYDQAEALLRARALRYENETDGWYTWCKFRGRGDLDAARDLVLEFYGRLAGPSDAHLADMGMFYFMENDLEKALTHFGQSFDSRRNPYDGLFAALIAKQLNRKEECLEFLSDARNYGWKFKFAGRKRAEMMKLAELFESSIRSKSGYDFDVDAAFKAMTEANEGEEFSEGERTNLDYFIGRFLQLHGRVELADKYLRRCAESPIYKSTRAAAVIALAELSQEKPEAKSEEKPL